MELQEEYPDTQIEIKPILCEACGKPKLEQISYACGDCELLETYRTEGAVPEKSLPNSRRCPIKTEIEWNEERPELCETCSKPKPKPKLFNRVECDAEGLNEHLRMPSEEPLSPNNGRFDFLDEEYSPEKPQSDPFNQEQQTEVVCSEDKCNGILYEVLGEEESHEIDESIPPEEKIDVNRCRRKS